MCGSTHCAEHWLVDWAHSQSYRGEQAQTPSTGLVPSAAARSSLQVRAALPPRSLAAA